MKRIVTAGLLAAALLLVSCGKEEDFNNPSKYTDLGGEKSEMSENRQSKDAQIDYIQSTCVDFLEESKELLSLDINKIVSDITYPMGTEDFQGAEEFYNNAMSWAKSEYGESYVDPDSESTYTRVNNILDLSAIKGTFIVSEDGKSISCSESKDLKIVSYNRNNERIELSYSFSGQPTLLYVSTSLDEDGDDPCAYVSFYKIPSKIKLNLKYNNDVVLDVNLNVAFKSVSKEGYFDFASSSVEASGKISSLDATLTIDKFKYQGNKALEVYANFSNGGKKKASLAGKVNLEFLGDASYRPGHSIAITSISNATDFSLFANVLGRLQLKATCSNALNFVRLLYENNDNAAYLKDLADVAIYFDNGSAKQAELSYVYEKEPYSENALYVSYGSNQRDKFKTFLSRETFPLVYEKYMEICDK